MQCPFCESVDLEARTELAREATGEVWTDTFDECRRCGAVVRPEDYANEQGAR